MQTFKLLYRSFYDTTLFSDFVMQGKNLGIRALGLIALIISLLVTGLFYSILSSFSFEEVRPLIADFPELTIQDGQIEEDVILTKEVMGRRKNFFFILNTTSETPDLSDLPDTGIYISKKAIFVFSGERVDKLALSKLFPSGKTVIGDDFFREGFEALKAVVLKYFIPVFLVVILVASFLWFLNCLLLFLFVSFFFSRFMKKAPTLEQRTRVVVLSLIPAIILSFVAGAFQVFLPMSVYFLVGLVYMYTYFRRFEDRTAADVVSQ